jgi:hypothetical protein
LYSSKTGQIVTGTDCCTPSYVSDIEHKEQQFKYKRVTSTKILCKVEFSKPKYVIIQQTKIYYKSANQNMLEFSKPKYVGIQQTKI